MGFNRSKADPKAIKDVKDVFLNRDTPAGTSEDGPSTNGSDAQATAEASDSSNVHAKEAHEQTNNSNSVASVSRNNNEYSEQDVQSEHPEGDTELPSSEEVQDEGHDSARSPSPVPTEIVPEPKKEVVPFETTVAPGIIARDYAFHPAPLRPPLLVFPILTTYIWFMYNRWRVIKQKPRIVLNAWQSAFLGCDLVYLVHFNWVSMKEISWMDARDWFGQGLIYLYEHPRDVEISYGAKRPSPKSPLMRKWFSRFAKCKTIEKNTLSKVKPGVNRVHERQDLNFYGPFGTAIHRYFPLEEHAVFRPLYNYLIGKGPKPEMSEKMERVFEPVLNCHGGGIGGRGKVYERPYDTDDEGPREGTEPAEVDVDPLLMAEEYSNVPAFGVYRRERAKLRERALHRMLREEEEARAKALARRRRKNYKWTHKKSRKASTRSTKDDCAEIIDVDTDPGRRCTRSMAKAAQESGGRPRVTHQTAVPARKNKGKGKAKESAESEDVLAAGKAKGKGKVKASSSSDGIMIGTKRKRNDENGSEIDYVEQPPEPGSSKRLVQGFTRRKLETEVELADLQVDENLADGITSSKHSATSGWARGTKRSLAPEPSEDLIEVFKRRRLDEAGSSERLVTSLPSYNDGYKPASGTSVNTGSLAGGITVGGSEVSAPTPNVTEPLVPTSAAEFMMERLQGAAAATTAQYPTTSNGNTRSAPELTPESHDESMPSQPLPQLAPPPLLPSIELIPSPPPPQNPPAPRPLRRTETTLFFGQMHRPT